MKKLMIILIMLIYACGNSFSQAPDTLWSKIHAITNDIDEGKCVRQTDDGGYIITGSCVPDGLVSCVDVLLLKTDPSGNIIWTKTYGKDFFEEGLSVAQTSDQGFIIVGRCVTGSYPIIDPPVSDVWILKTNANGDTLWTKTYGGNGNDYCTSIQQTSDLGYIMTGTMNAEYCYPKYEINEDYEPGTPRAWLIKTDSHGDTLWTKTYHERSHGNCVDQTFDGGYIIVGWIFPDEQDNQSDVLLIRTDSSGDTLWTKIIGGKDYDAGFFVRQTGDGYVIAGQTKPEGKPYDGLLIKTDLSGEVLWSKTFGGQLSDVAFSVDVSDERYFISGSTNGTWWVTAMSDMWAFETDVNGNLIWERIYNIRLTDISFSGIQSSDGGYVITGMTSGGFGGDLWLAKLGGEPTGVENNPPGITGYLLNQNYPNPFNAATKISFHLHEGTSVRLKIYDVLGRVIETLIEGPMPAGYHEIEWNSPNLPSGIYMCRLELNEYSKMMKMLLEK